MIKIKKFSVHHSINWDKYTAILPSDLLIILASWHGLHSTALNWKRSLSVTCKMRYNKKHLKILKDIHSSNSWTSFQAKTKRKPQKRGPEAQSSQSDISPRIVDHLKSLQSRSPSLITWTLELDNPIFCSI